jgi:ABC-type sugar transport system permease subunit
MVYTLLFVLISVGGALAVAMLLHARIRFGAFTALRACTGCDSTVATGIIFNWLLELTYGMANYRWARWGWGRTAFPGS